MPTAVSPHVRRGNGSRPGVRAALLCHVGGGAEAILVPTELVSQVIEYEVAPPPPLVAPWIGGYAVHDGRILISVTLDPAARGDRRGRGVERTTKGVELRLPGTGPGWVIEVRSVATLVDATFGATPFRPEAWPTWVAEARTGDGQRVAWIDVPALIAQATSPGAPR